ncbi:MAG: glycosyltransferase family 2 protein [Chloroflexi bacterium]|nr:glycosyltransferase family 2 protein [Chloroflexota bacterium]MBV9598204.1 glycosyltransferase family 2 protein [Chloroflexota bacterium]
MSVPVSVLVPTLDEELNLPECLQSVSWADEVFVVDSFSRDGTLEIARAHGARVVQHAFEGYSRQKNWALDNLPLRNEWVLIVDADERVMPDLRCEIERVVGLSPSGAHGFDGYYVNRRVIFLGTWVRHAGWYPSWNLRLFRHRLGRYDDREVHEHVVLDGRAGYLTADLLHADRRGLEAFVARHNRYSTLEATARWKAERNAPDRARLPISWLASPVHRKRFLRERIWPRLPAKPVVLFVYMYVLRQGFLDGRAGLALCVFHAFQEFVVGLKLAELRRLSSTGLVQ